MTHYSPGSSGLLKPLETWLSDPEVSEILLNQPQEIWVEKQGVLISHPVPEFTEAHLGVSGGEGQEEFLERIVLAFLS